MVEMVLSKWRNRSLGPRSFLTETRGRLNNVWMDARDGIRMPGASSRPKETSIAGVYPSAQTIRHTRHELAHILTENIIPFWYPATIDEVHGGYRLNHDGQGRWKGPANKGVVSQARTLWFFSRLARSEFGTSDHLKAAAHGFQFLKDRLWDEQFGGFYWETDAAGTSALAPRKHVFGQVAALYALCEFTRASNDTCAEALCRRHFDLLQQHAYDERYGGYKEYLDRDWQELPPDTPNYLGARLRVDAKTSNTHTHLMEATTSYYALTHDATARERLLNLLTVNGNSVVRKTRGATSPTYGRDWTPLRGGPYEYVFYGYQLKNVWLMIHTCEVAGLPQAPLLDLYRTLVDNAIRCGFDRRDGGFFQAGRLGAPATKRDKVWWTQAEALMCTLHMYRLTRDPAYFTCFQRTLHWISGSQVDWRYGDWFARVRKDIPSGDKADEWKDPYHHGRAMIEGFSMLENLGGG
jgi:mannose/cellobiose epimerase-like protein (N-acyl-D-glucosamine 2-epimerase family)